MKLLFLWMLVLLADYFLEFRFEYLWPFWLFLRSVYDSFKYQGLVSVTNPDIPEPHRVPFPGLMVVISHSFLAALFPARKLNPSDSLQSSELVGRPKNKGQAFMPIDKTFMMKSYEEKPYGT